MIQYVNVTLTNSSMQLCHACMGKFHYSHMRIITDLIYVINHIIIELFFINGQQRNNDALDYYIESGCTTHGNIYFDMFDLLRVAFISLCICMIYAYTIFDRMLRRCYNTLCFNYCIQRNNQLM